MRMLAPVFQAISAVSESIYVWEKKRRAKGRMGVEAEEGKV